MRFCDQEGKELALSQAVEFLSPSPSLDHDGARPVSLAARENENENGIAELSSGLNK